jgi:hypothetical protein
MLDCVLGMVEHNRDRVGYVSSPARTWCSLCNTHWSCYRSVCVEEDRPKPLTSVAVSFLGSLGATSLVMQRQALWLEAIERRIAATSAMLDAMKGVKMCGLTDLLREDLQRLRVDELNISKKFRKLLIWTMMICK